MTNPYESPSEAQAGFVNKHKNNNAFRRGCVCGALGFVVGLAWAAIFGAFTDGPPSLTLSFIVYSTGFALTGFVVGWSNRAPAGIGALAGAGILVAWAVMFGPKDGWIIIWLVSFGGSGLIWGTIIGCIWGGIRRRIAA